MTRGFIVGKFIPLHLGHLFLIDNALLHCSELMVLTYTSDSHGYPVSKRLKVLRELYPNVRVYGYPDQMVPEDNAEPELHRAFCCSAMEAQNFKPDIIFTSEDYGDGFASYASMYFDREVGHRCIDKDRINVPISASKIRSDYHTYKHFSLL